MNNLVYKSMPSTKQTKQLIGICLFYIIEFIAWVIIAKSYMNFGSQWITPCVSAMWIAGAVVSILIPEQRESTISATKWFIAGYLGMLLIYRIAIHLLTPITPDQMSASLNISGTTSGGIAISNFIQNLLLIIAATGPITFLVYLGKKFVVYKGRSTKTEAFTRNKGYR